MSMTTLQGLQSPAFSSLQSMQAKPAVPPWLEAFMPRKGETPFNQFMNTLMNPKGTNAGAELKASGQMLMGIGQMMQGLGRLMNAKPDGQSNPGPQPHAGLGQILAAIVAAAMQQALQALQSAEGEKEGDADTAGANGQPGKSAPARTEGRGAGPSKTMAAQPDAGPALGAAALPMGGTKGAEHSESRMTRMTKETTTTTVETNSDRSTAAPGRATNAAA
jgi:hypothetical protein